MILRNNSATDTRVSYIFSGSKSQKLSRPSSMTINSKCINMLSRLGRPHGVHKTFTTRQKESVPIIPRSRCAGYVLEYHLQWKMLSA